jgi:hypothetical protein
VVTQPHRLVAGFRRGDRQQDGPATHSNLIGKYWRPRALRRDTLGDRALRPAQPESTSFSDELDDLTDAGIGPKILFQLLDARLKRAGFSKEPSYSFLHGLDLLFREAAAFQTNKVETGKVGTITLYPTKRDDIAFDTRRAANHCEGADSDELMHRCESPITTRSPTRTCPPRVALLAITT